jgi:hypothetical protein
MSDTRKKRPTRRTNGPGNHGYLRGGARPLVYDVWKAMVQRCCNPDCREFPHYGGRGIKVCPRWLEANGFAHFLADLGPRPPCPRKRALSLHQLDNDGDYEPGNVAWADYKTQTRNRRSNRVLTHGGRSMLLCEWAEALGMKEVTLSQRLFKDWPVERALTEPVRARMPSSQWKRNPNAKKRGPKPRPRGAGASTDPARQPKGVQP